MSGPEGESPKPTPWALPGGTPPAAERGDENPTVVVPPPVSGVAVPPDAAQAAPGTYPQAAYPPDHSPAYAPPPSPAGQPATGYPQGTGYPPAGQPATGYPPGTGYPQGPQAAAGGPPSGYGQAGFPLPVAGPRKGPGRGTLAALVIGGLVLVLMVGTGVVLLGRSALDKSSSTWSTGPRNGDGDPRDEPTSPTPSATASKEPWAVRINGYCRIVDRQLKAIPEAETANGQVVWLQLTAGVIRNMNKRLRGMEVPAAKRQDYDAMMTAWERVPISYDQAAEAVRKQDKNAVRTAMDQAERENDKGNAIANELGLTDCAGAGGLGNSTGASSSPDDDI
ncbi:MAG: hypothetical protein QG622_777 [Actinomycetota bacterium]|nr:hypothetical protein [Actinomycetota bacterium]